MNFKKQTIIFLGIYVLCRIFSFYFQPASALNTIVSLVILLTVIWFLIKQNNLGWLIIAAEIILGGAGNFLSIGSISLRTCLLFSSLAIYFTRQIQTKKIKELVILNQKYFIFISVLLCWVILSSINGYWRQHNLSLIFAEAIPYVFFLYYLPAKQLLSDEKIKQSFLVMLMAAVIGNCLFILFTFIGYSSGLFILQDPYYHWFRDVANGKITELPYHFYRLVLNEQLLLAPLSVYFISKLIKKFSWLYFWAAFLLLTILSVNFTRIYILALGAGFIFLFEKTNVKKWLLYSLVSFLIFFFSFTIIHTLASRGQSLGWEFFGIRLQSITSPATEDSSLSRLLLLPKIMAKISAHPIFGAGLGDTVTVFSPIFKQTITTPHFDWGYLEIIDEMGFVGLIIWFIVILKIFIQPMYKKNMAALATIITLLVINITSPALFHVMGTIWMMFILTANHAFLRQSS